ncbi:MFS transporter [Micromonospora tarensis]|uniref:MFS transporter n=1 Tax=Micromonospora tarensis TaxID=2806100 RepID=A0ABS1YCD1_9ACTN|nr:MFS transporter [Micromonospora tarensis]MBM0275034.1 MFS transporter [Micromonospora tarensis]
MAVLATAGAIAAYTYVALFVTEVSGLSASSVGVILLARGIASVLGILAVGALLDRNPWLALLTTVALQSAALLGLYTLGQQPSLSVGLIALGGLAFAAFTAALGGLVLQVAPGRADLAAATVSAAVNVGITAGAFVGGLALPSHGVRTTVLIGALLGVVALVLALGERLIRPALDRSGGERRAEPIRLARQTTTPSSRGTSRPVRFARRVRW